MEKISAILEKINNLLEVKKPGTLNKDITVTIGPASGLPRGTKKTIKIPKGTKVEVFHYGKGDYNVHVVDGKYKGQEISRKTSFDDIKFKK